MTTIQVTGDLVVNADLYRLPAHSTEASPAARLRYSLGGAWYLSRVIEAACTDIADGVTVLGPTADPPEAERVFPQIAQSVAIWSPHEQQRGMRQYVWRIDQFMGSQQGSGPPLERMDPEWSTVLVIDDLNLGFRHASSSWPDALRSVANGPEIMLKTVAPLGEGLLWEALSRDHWERLTVVLSVDSLRARHAAIPPALSWDKAIEDLDRELTDGRSALDLAHAQRVAVCFPHAALAIYTRRNGRALALERFVFLPNELEGAWLEDHPGVTFGSTSLVAASLVRHIAEPAGYPIFIAAARALAAMRKGHERGGGAIVRRAGQVEPAEHSDDASDPTIRKLLHPCEETRASLLPECDFRAAFPHDLLPSDEGKQRRELVSNLLEDATGGGYEYMSATAVQVVLHGVDQALSSAPKARYGKWVTVDREEIERMTEVRRLLKSYQTNPKERRPLSLAVFGPPGSGKSFAIKQLAAELFGERQAVLEFNLSQFGSRDDLHPAFDRIRDASVHGKIPLVFWDEFDSNDLKWLAEFLGPMQDAEFLVRGRGHPFGKAIFVFAGGTRDTFEEFDRSEGPTRSAIEQFRAVKGPDFVSRLRGYVNIKGPNPVFTARDAHPVRADQDVAHLIRRAILLRSILHELHPQLIDDATGTAAISTKVVRAFLRASAFLHGARSIEAIVGMSSLAGARSFGVSELPSAGLLQLHVTPDFLEHLSGGELDDVAIEHVAKAIHEAWADVRGRAGWYFGAIRSDETKEHPMLLHYHRLEEPDKERNRHTARVVLAKLHEIGFRVVPVRPGARGPRAFTSADRERLMRIEHEFWLRHHLLHGYDCSATTNERLRLHRDVTKYGGLPAEDKELNGAIIDCVPKALWLGGYVLAKAPRRPARIRVGVTGHRVLSDVAPILDGLAEALARIESSFGKRPLTVLSALAEGADRLVAEAVLRMPDAELVAVLPRAVPEYAMDFGDPGSASRVHFEMLLARATEIQVLDESESVEAGYRSAGHRIVKESDLLIAIWDGRPPQGDGGTGEIVAFARQQAKPIIIIQAGNRIAATGEASSLGADQGRLRLERMADGRGLRHRSKRLAPV